MTNSKSLGDQARSISKKLSNIARTRETAYVNVLTEFLIERLLTRITSDKNLQKVLVFKGGFVSLKIYSSPRYTIDLDAVLKKADIRKVLDQVREVAGKDLGDGVWFRFESEVSLTAQREYGGIRLIFRSGIGEVLNDIKRAQVINFDLGIGDPITPAPAEVKTPMLLDKDPVYWQVYPIETIIAEKIHALIDRGSDNSRSKDIFDLYLFLPKADSKRLKVALKACFEYRETQLPENLVGELKKINLNLLSKGWSGATATIDGAPTCEEAFKEIVKVLTRLEKSW